MSGDTLPRWYFAEFEPVGVDLGSVMAVAAFDRSHGTDPAGDEELLRRLGAGPGTVLVDLGCGTGSLLVEAARRGVAAHGVDVSENMLSFTRQRAAEAGVEVCLHRAGFLSYEHHGGPADFVTVRSALHQLPDFWKQVALIRIRQLMRPGGVLYLSDVVWSFPPKDCRVLADTPYDELPVAAIERMGMSQGQRNLLVRIVIRHPDQTLTDAEANELRDRIYAALHQGTTQEWAT